MTEEVKNAAPQGWPRHAIQLVAIRVVTLHLQANLEVDPSTRHAGFALETANSAYDEEDSTVEVRVRMRAGFDDDKRSAEGPYSLEIELLGVFNVDAKKFPLQHLDHWAKHNAPIVIYPYLREHAMSTAIRGGFEPIILPLLEVPTFKVAKPESSAADVVATK